MLCGTGMTNAVSDCSLFFIRMKYSSLMHNNTNLQQLWLKCRFGLVSRKISSWY